MCDLPLSEDMAMKYHAKIKNIIRVFKVQMKDYCLKDKVRSIQDQLQRIKICHANRRRQREHREQNKQYREEFFQKIKTADNTPCTEENRNAKTELYSEEHQPEQLDSQKAGFNKESLLSILSKSQECIQMEHLKIMNTNMMLEICSNELQIAIKEQKTDMQTVQEKISNILQQINKQKLLLFNNFQNITKGFNEQKQALEAQTSLNTTELKSNL